MKSILRQLQELADADLFTLSEAVDLEMLRRERAAEAAGEVLDSARRRVVERGQSYRQRTGSGAPPIRVIGLGKPSTRRAA